MGEEVYRLNQQNKNEVYFYNKFYECPIAGQTYGHLLDIPLPSFQSQEWEVPCTQTVEYVRTKIAADIKNNMKVTFGSKRMHLKWLVPRRQEVKKTRTMFTIPNCPKVFLPELFGAACLKKEVCTGKEVVQAIFDTSSTTFKYIIKTLELHVTFSFRRYKREGTIWREMEYAGEEASMISTIVFLNGVAPEEIQVERSWTLLDVRHLLQRNECYLEDVEFFHLNKVVRKRRESTFSVQEMLRNQDRLNLYITSN
ncbi:hypothetical protein L7F22_020115 [Adiantum nelumboides]|nr:hypothetical protein [Adiantum nelumboides]